LIGDHRGGALRFYIPVFVLRLKVRSNRGREHYITNVIGIDIRKEFMSERGKRLKSAGYQYGKGGKGSALWEAFQN